MIRRSLEDKHVIITGASAGIGRALAMDMAKRGARVSLAGRSVDKLEQVAAQITRAGGSVQTIWLSAAQSRPDAATS